uniref:Universal stress protein n=1 Tax=Oscillatoriales cyanobacterium SpSt-402 TaxID=2282168 RepID=A0A832H1C9_9CYAN
MLTRLEHALNSPGLAKQMVLRSKEPSVFQPPADDINLVVGYNGSTHSQTALDLTLWIAHQTRLATQKMVTVQVIYVVELESTYPAPQDGLPELCLPSLDIYSDGFEIWAGRSNLDSCTERLTSNGTCQTGLVAIADCPDKTRVSLEQSSDRQIQQFEKADRILWQARHLADEWRGSLETHLRFGCVAEELKIVSQQVSTTALLLGCSSAKHPTVQALGGNLPFPVLGIPPKLPLR